MEFRHATVLIPSPRLGGVPLSTEARRRCEGLEMAVKTDVFKPNTETQTRHSLFAVRGNSRETRRERIEAVAKAEPSIGFLAAVFDFEWMMRRAILALSIRPTAEIKVWLAKRHGLDDYKKAWKEFVHTRSDGEYPSLYALVTKGCNTPPVDWAALKDAFEQRHLLVHGSRGFIEDDMAQLNMGLFLDASKTIESFLNLKGKSAFKTIPNRRTNTLKNVAERTYVANNRKNEDMRYARVKKRAASKAEFPNRK